MPKTKISTLTDFPTTVVFDGLGFCFSFSRWYCLHAVFYGQSGTFIMELCYGLGSTKVWGPVTQRKLQRLLHIWLRRAESSIDVKQVQVQGAGKN